MPRPARPFGSVRQLPSGRFQARFKKGETTVVAPDTFATERDAWRWLNGQKADIDRGVWEPPRKGLPISETPRFGEYAADWLAGRDLKPRTRALYASLLDRIVLPTFAAVPLDDITPVMVRNWHSRLDATTPTQRAHAYSLLRTVLNGAVADGILGSNPCRVRGAGYAKRQRKIAPATLAELETIVSNVPEKYRLLILLAAWCGPRFGELTELRRLDVELTYSARDIREPDGAVLHISRAVVYLNGERIIGTPKSDAGVRDVTVPPHLVPAIVEHLRSRVGPRGDALLFTGADGVSHLPEGSVKKVFVPARRLAGRPDLRFHDLRHTGATLAAVTGATLAELMSRIGHSTPAAALRYQHAAADRDRVIADALSALASTNVEPLRRRPAATT